MKGCVYIYIRKHTKRSTFLRRSLHDSNLSTARLLSEIRSFSRLMVCSTLSRFVAVSDDSAMTDFICSFSASRLKGFFLPLDLPSFFFLSELLKMELPPLAMDRDDAC